MFVVPLLTVTTAMVVYFFPNTGNPFFWLTRKVSDIIQERINKKVRNHLNLFYFYFKLNAITF